jgi:putative tryptophan/tyrosine transport system substrate-binding protein
MYRQIDHSGSEFYRADCAADPLEGKYVFGMGRREFIMLLGGAAAAWPVAARAQQGDRVRFLAAMMGGRNADTDLEGRAWFAAFRQGLQELGWSEGRNFRADYRWPSDDLDRMRAIAKEFVDLKPDVIFAGNTPSVEALLRETRTIPIVFTNLSDPVGTGLIESLARPGGNATGFTAYEYSLAGKWLEMLKEIAPAVTRVALMFNPETAPYAQYYLRFIETSAPGFGVTANPAPVRSISEIEAAIEAQARASGGGLIVLPETFTFSNRAPLIALAARYRLPAIYAIRGQAIDGGLLSYGPDTVDLYKRAAAYVDRILKGEKPADLPVQNPNKYVLVINLKTAKALGLQIPDKLLALADEVIE